MLRMIRFLSGPVRLGALAIAAATLLAISQAHAANIISFGDGPNSCGGAVLCASDGNAITGGTLGYRGTNPFSLTTIDDWFQIDTEVPTPVNHLPHTQTMAEPNGGAGDFLVINNTGAPVTTFSLTITDTFSSTTPSVGPCGPGPQSGNSVGCDDFQNHGGSLYMFDTELSGADWNDCTQGTTVLKTCVGNAGGVAADFAPNMVTYTWTTTPGVSIPAGAEFLIDFASWQGTSENNSAFATQPVPTVPEPTSMALLGAGLAALGIFRRRHRPAARS